VPTDVLAQPEFGRRIRAARGYAALSQPELGQLLQVSEGYIRQVEGGKVLKPVQARGLAERVAEVCDLPVGFFTGDFGRLADDHVPEDELQRLRETVEQVSQDVKEAGRRRSGESAAQQEALAKRLGRLERNLQQHRREFDELTTLMREWVDTMNDRIASRPKRPAKR
jgi:transcriptional regulator with XRE-family HTH domain